MTPSLKGMGGQRQYYLDSETKLYLLGSGAKDNLPGTYYDPSTARRLSEDPIRQASGDASLYPIVQNNPVNQTDPSGHDLVDNEQRKKEVQRLLASAGVGDVSFAAGEANLTTTNPSPGLAKRTSFGDVSDLQSRINYTQAHGGQDYQYLKSELELATADLKSRLEYTKAHGGKNQQYLESQLTIAGAGIDQNPLSKYLLTPQQTGKPKPAQGLYNATIGPTTYEQARIGELESYLRDHPNDQGRSEELANLKQVQAEGWGSVFRSNIQEAGANILMGMSVQPGDEELVEPEAPQPRIESPVGDRGAAENAAAEEAAKAANVTAPIDFDGHILSADVKANGNVVGGHSTATGEVKVIQGTASAPNSYGVYKAKIEVADPSNPGQFLAKTNNGGYSTLFPDSWSANRVKIEVDAAFKNKTVAGNKWSGTTPSGVKVEGYLSPKTTVYPIY